MQGLQSMSTDKPGQNPAQNRHCSRDEPGTHKERGLSSLDNNGQPFFRSFSLRVKKGRLPFIGVTVALNGFANTVHSADAGET